jgi:hypothetical protein
MQESLTGYNNVQRIYKSATVKQKFHKIITISSLFQMQRQSVPQKLNILLASQSELAVIFQVTIRFPRRTESIEELCR